jgi:hypothetical protein
LVQFDLALASRHAAFRRHVVDAMNWHHEFRPFVDPEAKRLPMWLTKEDADIKAQRAFWRGVLIGGMATGAGFLAGMVW